MKKINRISRLTICLALLLSIVGCSDLKTWEYKENIDAVYYHEKERYTVVIRKQNNGFEFRELPRGAHVVVIEDVSDEGMEYVICNYSRDEWGGEKKGGCEIHIKNINSVMGGDWNHGKFGRGSTIKCY